jgi:hypothetical protein
MAFSPIAFIAPNYRDYGTYWLRAYLPGTTTPKPLAIDAAAATTFAKLQLNVNGFFKSAAGALITPYVDGPYDAYLFQTEEDADENDTSTAVRIADNITPTVLPGLFPTGLTTLQLIASSEIFTAETVINTSGYALSGDRGNGSWKQTGVTSLTASQSPLQLNTPFLNDGLGNQWATTVATSIKSEDFGFSHTNTSADNLATLTIAYTACSEGGTVTINQKENFTCGRLNLSGGKEFSLEVNGVGKWIVSTERALTVIQPFQNLLSVTAIDLVVLTVNGGTVDVIRLTVSDSSTYAKGDAVKVFNDQLDVFDGRSNRRKGEFAEVIDVATGFIYLTCRLEDVYDTASNVRIARMSKKRFSFKGDFISNIANTEDVINLEGIYKPTIRLAIENHGKIVVNLKSSYLGNYYLSGSGYTDNTGTLGYLANDSAGYHNVYHAPFGKFFRHVVTSNATGVASGVDSPEDYGPTRGMTVRDGVSVGAMGAPWDDHDGARRSQFINCKSLNPLRSSATYPCTFQLRGRDTKVFGGETVGPTHLINNDYAHIRFGDTASGQMQINDTTCVTAIQGLVFIVPPSSNLRGELSVSVNGGNIRFTEIQGLVDVQNMNMQMTGTTIEFLNASANFTQLFDVTNAKLYLSNVTVKVAGTGGNARAVRLNTNAKVMGRFYLDVSGVTYTSGVLSESTGNSSFLTIVNAGGSAGSLVDVGSFDFVSNTIVTM